MKILIDAGCDTTALNSTRETVLEIAMQRSFTSMVELLLPCDVPLPPDVLLTALQRGTTLEMVEYLIRRGADVRSTTSDGDTVLHLALADMDRTEEECCKFVQCLVNAGCNPSTCNSMGKAVLLAAIERSFSSVVELLLLFSVSVPPDILHTALGHCKPQMVQVLTRKVYDNDHLRIASGSNCEWVTQLPLAIPYSEQYSQRVTEIPEARKPCRTRSSFEDETYMHVAKRPRLDEQEQPGMRY